MVMTRSVESSVGRSWARASSSTRESCTRPNLKVAKLLRARAHCRRGHFFSTLSTSCSAFLLQPQSSRSTHRSQSSRLTFSSQNRIMFTSFTFFFIFTVNGAESPFGGRTLHAVACLARHLEPAPRLLLANSSLIPC